MKITRISDIPKFTSDGDYEIGLSIKRVPQWVKEEQEESNLQLEPEFQRGHVWNEDQQIAWLEYFMRGGKSGNTLYFNCPSYHHQVNDGDYNDYVCVDGLQRLTAIMRFVNNEIKVFGSYFREFEDPILFNEINVIINVNDLKSEKEVLRWYIDMNSGGTPHTQEEIARVKKMLQECERR